MIRRMSRKVVLLAAAACLGVSLPALADEKKPRKDDEDVVIDNRGLAKEKAAAEEKKEQEMFENDTPFAKSEPDPKGQRQGRWKPGFGGGARLGFALPMGDYSGSRKLKDTADGLIFAGGEAGYWPSPYFFVGLGLTGGYVLPDCGDEASCSGWELRGGPLAIFRIEPHKTITPYVGVGAGYEWMTVSASSDTVSVRRSAHGLEYLNLQLGLEVEKNGDFWGVFIGYSLGKFQKESISIESDVLGDSDDSGSVDDPRMHNWLAIGARAAID